MVLNSNLHPGQKSLRMPYRDYAAPGIYFLTICTYDRRASLARIEEGNVHLTSIGEIASECWSQIPAHYLKASLHAFIVMPNHVHDLLQLMALGVPSKPNIARREFGPSCVPSSSLSSVIRSFQSSVTRLSPARLGAHGDIWERNYFERGIRSGQEFDEVTRYIVENPSKWELDREKPEALKTHKT